MKLRWSMSASIRHVGDREYQPLVLVAELIVSEPVSGLLNESFLPPVVSALRGDEGTRNVGDSMFPLVVIRA